MVLKLLLLMTDIPYSNMKCIKCEEKATKVYRPDLDLTGLGMCDEHEEEVQTDIIIATLEGWDHFKNKYFMAYKITQYTKDQAKKLGVEVKSSSVKGKKIDVFKNGKKIASVGASGYKDYPTYIKEKGKDYADERRRLYKKRHDKNRKVKGSNGWWADKLLW